MVDINKLGFLNNLNLNGKSSGGNPLNKDDNMPILFFDKMANFSSVPDKTEEVLDDGTVIVRTPNSIKKTLPNGRVIFTRKDEDGNLTTTITENGESVTLRYDDDGNILTNAKQGETFRKTGERVGIEYNTPDYEAYSELNPEAAKKGWFRAGEEVKIPAGMEDRVNISELDVDIESEKRRGNEKYKEEQVKKQIDNTKFGKKFSRENLEKQYPKDKYTYREFYDLDGKDIYIYSKNSPESIKIQIRLNGHAQTYHQYANFDTEFIVFREGYYDMPNGADIESITRTQNGKTTSQAFDKNGTISRSGTARGMYSYDEKTIIYDDGTYAVSTEQLAEDLKRAIYAKNAVGLPTTGKNLGSYIQKINKHNVNEVMKLYNDLTDESLLAGIIKERGLSTDERAEYLLHIRQVMVDAAKAEGKYTADIEQMFNEEVLLQMNKLGFANTKYLDRIVNKLNERSAVTEIEAPNGKIDDDFSQGQETGDCWLVATIKALADTPKGQKILNDSLKVDKNGNVTVTLKGVNKTYTITKEELAGNTQFSSGDSDVRAIEIAMDRYFKEERGTHLMIDDGNMPSVALHLLTGKGERGFISDYFGRILERRFSDRQIDNFNKPNHVAIVFSSPNLTKTKDATGTILKNTNENMSEEQQVSLRQLHGYTVKGSDKNNVYLINPWDTSEVIAVDRETFKKFFNGIDEIDL